MKKAAVVLLLFSLGIGGAMLFRKPAKDRSVRRFLRHVSWFASRAKKRYSTRLTLLCRACLLHLLHLLHLLSSNEWTVHRVSRNDRRCCSPVPGHRFPNCERDATTSFEPVASGSC